MYETQTFENVLARMLERIPDTLDKRQGSVIYDALAPAAVEICNLYVAFDAMLEETFGDTASREYLIRLCNDRGITPKAATAAICACEFNEGAEVPQGSRFTGGNTTYVYLGAKQLECEELGTIGNEYLGSIVPIDYIESLTSAAITVIDVFGEDEEDTEELRSRYYSSFKTKAFGGNKQDYYEKTLAISGVGAAKITPVFNGAGTVKITLLSSEYAKATEALVAMVQKTFDPKQDGKGDGLAPIGHVVTVASAVEKIINVTTEITYADGYNQTMLKESIKQKIDDYLLSLRKDWENKEALSVLVSHIDSAILSVQGVLDVSATKINGQSGNLFLDAEEIPILGVVNNA